MPKVWTSKPPLGSQINWGHPLSKGLTACLVMQEGTSMRTKNLITGVFEPISVLTYIDSWGKNTKGTGVLFRRDTYNTKIPITKDPISTSLPFTIVASVSPTTNNAAYGVILSRGQDSQGAGRSVSYGRNADGTFYIQVITTSPSTTARTTTGTKIYPANTLVQVVAVWNPAISLSLHTNGTLDKYNADSTSNLRTSTVGTAIGHFYGSTNFFDGLMNYVYIYNRALSPQEIQQLYIDPYCFIKQPRILISTPTASCALTGTITASVTEADVVSGGLTCVLTLTGDTWVATVGEDNAITDALIAGIDSGQSEANGWDAVVKANMVYTDVVRTSDTVVTITLGAEATYNITSTETITATVPATALTGAAQLVASPTFTVAPVTSGVVPLRMLMGCGV